MKMVILAGGQKSTLTGDGSAIPKPMIDIGGKPLLWHIMKHASTFGIRDFIICGGYKTEVIKEYFRYFNMYQSDVMFNTRTNSVTMLKESSEDWNVIVSDTGLHTSPVERLKLIKKYVGDEDFIVSYGDCLTDIDFTDFIETHQRGKQQISVVAGHPAGRKASFNIAGNKVITDENYWTSAGIFILNQQALSSLKENGNIENVVREVGNSKTLFYKHSGYCSIVETMRDKDEAELMWKKDIAPWI